jgi:predicted O-methyltransferase YrrM
MNEAEKVNAEKYILITPDIAEYIDGLITPAENPQIEKVRQEQSAIEHGEMQTMLSQMRFVDGLLKAIDARRVLELGTFRGYGAARLAQTLPHDGKVITCDHDVRILDDVPTRWKELGVEDKIELRMGAALDSLAQMENELNAGTLEKFDCIFIDVDKENNIKYVETGIKLLRSRGIILIDNILWRGNVVNSNPETMDNATRHLRKFNQWVFDTYKDRASVLPVWDGMIMIVKE